MAERMPIGHSSVHNIEAMSWVYFGRRAQYEHASHQFAVVASADLDVMSVNLYAGEKRIEMLSLGMSL